MQKILPKMEFENNQASHFAGIKYHYDYLIPKLAWEIRKNIFRYKNLFKLLSERNIKKGQIVKLYTFSHRIWIVAPKNYDVG
jgi:hypothetical protein